jgi:hypothetical protein
MNPIIISFASEELLVLFLFKLPIINNIMYTWDPQLTFY